jgi:uncharacterized membrane protein
LFPQGILGYAFSYPSGSENGIMATAPATAPVTTPSPAKPGRFQAKHVLFIVLGVMAIFVLIQRDLQLLDANSPLRQRYAKVPWWMLSHGVPGALALFLAPFQFSNRLRARHLQLHRVMGRFYVGSALLAAIASVPVAIVLGSPPTLIMATVVQSTGWILTTATALYCVRTGKIQQHREWMMRSYPFAMVFVVVRVIIAIPAVARMGLDGLVATVWSVIAIACFLPSFLIAWRGVFPTKTASVMARG